MNLVRLQPVPRAHCPQCDTSLGMIGLCVYCIIAVDNLSTAMRKVLA